jgi:hypothetical protein
MNTYIPKSVHLVGSIGLDTVEEVFRTVGEMLGPYLQRVPDGEVGGRKLWISWQYPLLRASVYLRPDPSGAVRPTNRFPLLGLAGCYTFRGAFRRTWLRARGACFVS